MPFQDQFIVYKRYEHSFYVGFLLAQADGKPRFTLVRRSNCQLGETAHPQSAAGNLPAVGNERWLITLDCPPNNGELWLFSFVGEAELVPFETGAGCLCGAGRGQKSLKTNERTEEDELAKLERGFHNVRRVILAHCWYFCFQIGDGHLTVGISGFGKSEDFRG